MSRYLPQAEVLALDFVGIPRRRWKTIVAVCLAGFLVAGVYIWHLPKQYVASATVLVNPITTTPFDASKSADQLVNISTEAHLASSLSVAQGAADILGPPAQGDKLLSNLSVSANAGTTTLLITYVGASPDRAAAVANAFGKSYLDHRDAQAQAQQKAMLDNISKQLSRLQEQLKAINKAISSTSTNSATRQDAITQRSLISQQITDLTTRQNDLESLSVDAGSMVSSASSDLVQAKPNYKIYGAAAVLIVLVVAFALAFVRDRTDRRVMAVRDLERVSGVEAWATVRYARRAGLVSVPAPSTDLLRSHVLATGAKSILFVDHAVTVDGSVVAALTASSIARSGRDVSLIVPEEPSEELADVLAALQLTGKTETAAEGVDRAVSGLFPSLRILAVRPSSMAVGDVVASEAFGVALAQERAESRLLVTAVSHAVDASVLISVARDSEAMVLMAEWRRTNLSHLWDTLGAIETDVLRGSVLLKPKRAARHGSRPRRTSGPAAVISTGTPSTDSSNGSPAAVERLSV